MGSYVDENGVKHIRVNMPAPKQQNAYRCSVVAVLPNGETFGVYESIKQASIAVGRAVNQIGNSIRKGAICKGMKWYRSDEHRKLWFIHGQEGFAFELHSDRDECGNFKAGTKRKNPFANFTPEQYAALSKQRSEHARRMAHDPNSNFGKIKVVARPVCTIDGSKRWNDAQECANELGVRKGSVRTAICRNHRIKGMRLKYEF